MRVASTGLTARPATSLSAVVSPGAVALDFHGPGIQSSATVNASPGVTTKVTVLRKSDWAADALLVILRSEATKNLLRSNRLILTRADPSLRSG